MKQEDVDRILSSRRYMKQSHTVTESSKASRMAGIICLVASIAIGFAL